MGSGRKYKIYINVLFIVVFFIISGCTGKNIKDSSLPLKSSEVKKEFKKIYPDLVKCYEKTIVSKNGFYGKGLLIIKIDKSGSVTDYKWKPSPPDNFVICTDRVIKNIKFRKLPDSVSITLPVSFIISVEDKYEIK